MGGSAVQESEPAADDVVAEACEPTALSGWGVSRYSLEDAVRHALGEWVRGVGELLEAAGDWLEGEESDREREEPRRWKLRKLSRLDRTRIFVAEEGITAPAITGVRIPSGGLITAAVTIQTPRDARPGDRFRLDVLQRQGHSIVGGSTYIIVVTRR